MNTNGHQPLFVNNLCPFVVCRDVVSILAALAYLTYTESIRESRRSDAMTALMAGRARINS